MDEGAFALIDCLGFKGIWGRYEASLVINKLNLIEQTIKAELKQQNPGPFALKITLLSDTVAISLKNQGRPQPGIINDRLVTILCLMVPRLINIFLNGDPTLVLRGCISFGKHISEGNFIIGPAVDEAAEHINIAEGAFIWLLPDAAKMYQDTWPQTEKMVKEAFETKKETENNILYQFFQELHCNKSASSHHVINYNMPLKGGMRLKSDIINPFANCLPDLDVIKNLYAKTMDSKKLDVWVKRQNTIEFIEEAYKLTLGHFQSLEGLFEKYNRIPAFKEALKRTSPASIDLIKNTVPFHKFIQNPDLPPDLLKE